MKYLKVLGLAAVAATAVMAFGAGTASAAQICVPDTIKFDGKCPTATAEREYNPATDTITATSSNPVLTSSITNVTCKESATTVAGSSSTGATISGEVTALSFTNDCTTAGGTSCTVTVVNLPYPSSLTSSELTVNDASGAGAKVVCGVLINCTFTTTDAVLSVNHDTFQATVKLNRSGGFCPETAEWHATYKITHPAGTTVL